MTTCDHCGSVAKQLGQHPPAELATWRKRARQSGMSLREWVEHSLHAAPALAAETTTIVRPKEAL